MSLCDQEGGVRAGVVVAADVLSAANAGGPLTDVDRWVREVVAQHHPVLDRAVCPFITPALEHGTLFYVPVTGCRRPEDVVAVMGEMVERFLVLPPMEGSHAHLKTLVVVFVDVQEVDAQRVVIAAHHELKNYCTERELMIGEFAPGYRLESTRDPAVNVGEAPAPVLALRHMLPTDRRFLHAEDRWMTAWASRFGADRVPLFQPCSVAELAAIGRVAHEMTVDPGRVLCREGDAGDWFFLILDGKASVARGGKIVAMLESGSCFGELALLTNRRRNATVTATTPATLLVLNRREFREILDTFPPLATKLLVSLAERLSRAEEALLRD